MKSLYVTSIESYSGKTAACLGLGKRFLNDGYRVGYLKPLSFQPWRGAGGISDEDATFVKEVLSLSEQPWELSPVVVTSEFLRKHLRGEDEGDLMEKVRSAYEAASKDRDIMLLEGGGSLREGYVVGLPTPVVARTFSSDILVIVKYSSEVCILDDVLTAEVRLGELLTGVIINRVPTDAVDFVSGFAIPYLEEHGIKVFGVLPEVPRLAALTVEELIDTLKAKVLTEKVDRNALAENLTVGAMTQDAALHRFRKQVNKAVITGGDRTDIQLAALETSTTCLVLTGNLQPSPLVVKQADSFGVSVLLVPTNTMETVEAIERVFGKTRLGQPAKLTQFEELLSEHVDMGRLYESLELERPK
jgi:BioD-like phosphotransacetylase family protein